MSSSTRRSTRAAAATNHHRPLPDNLVEEARLLVVNFGGSFDNIPSNDKDPLREHYLQYRHSLGQEPSGDRVRSTINELLRRMDREAQVVPPPQWPTLPKGKFDFFRDYAQQLDDETWVPDVDKFCRRVKEEQRNLDKVEMVAATFLADLEKKCVAGKNIGKATSHGRLHGWECLGSIWVEFHHGVPRSTSGHNPQWPSRLNLYPLVPKDHLRVYCYLAILFPEQKKMAFAWGQLLNRGKTHHSGKRDWDNDSARNDLFPQDSTWKDAFDRAFQIYTTWQSINNIAPPSDNPAVNAKRKRIREQKRKMRWGGQRTTFSKEERDALLAGAKKYEHKTKKWVLVKKDHEYADVLCNRDCRQLSRHYSYLSNL